MQAGSHLVSGLFLFDVAAAFGLVRRCDCIAKVERS